MASFKDNQGTEWTLHLKTDAVMRVAEIVKDKDGRPIHLLDMADTGDLYQLYGNAQTMIDVVFVCLIDQIKTQFNEGEFDKQYAVDMELLPTLKGNLLKKMGYWFGSRLGGSEIEAMTEAFKESLVNFTRNPHQRKALKGVLEKQDELIRRHAERVIQTTEQRFQTTNEVMEALIQEEENKTPEQIMASLKSALST